MENVRLPGVSAVGDDAHIPWCDDTHNANGLVNHKVGDAGDGGWHNVSIVAHRLAGEPLQEACCTIEKSVSIRAREREQAEVDLTSIGYLAASVG